MPRSASSSIDVPLNGYELINHPGLNKGTAFTERERDEFSLHGLLPPHESNLEEQVERRMRALETQPTPFAKYTFMRDLQDANETLFYACIARHVEELLPIVYTPTVGEGCQRFSEIWRKPRGLFLSYPNRQRIPDILSHPHFDSVRCIVVSDGERILGLGDQGAGGMGIPIGKMALYTGLGGIAPEFGLPILLDVGTDNEERLEDPLYIGWRHQRIRGPEYDEFINTFLGAVKKRWPNVLLQWEDFAGSNAARLLKRYRDELCTFNDDIQGTAAVTSGALLSAMQASGSKVSEHTFVIVGMGSAGIGIANLLISFMQDEALSGEDAYGRFFGVDMHGLLVDGGPGIRAEQAPFCRKRSEVERWKIRNVNNISFEEVVRNAKPTVLIGVSGQRGIFTEEVVRDMAKNTERPIIFPLSNPTSKSEGTPEQLLAWTDSRALIGTGSPFDPVKRDGKQVRICQVNNSYTFPGLALGIISSRATRVSDGMIKAAARALAELSPTAKDPKADLLPPLTESRRNSVVIARAVGRQALRDQLSQVTSDALDDTIQANLWEPVYRPYKRKA